MSRRPALRHAPSAVPALAAVLALAAVVAMLAAACAGANSPALSTPAAATAAPAPATVAPAPGSGTPASAPDAALPASVTVADAAALRDAGAFVLDVRQPEEWAEVHIPGAMLIPLGELPGRIGEVPRDRDVVVVCRSGNRSQAGRDILLQAGYRRVTSMTGGVREWQAAGLPTASGD